MNLNYNYYMEITLKLYADRFIRENYNSICPRFKALDKNISDSSCLNAMDKMHDVMISLYDSKEIFTDYITFKKWAMLKFTEREKRNG